MTPLSQTDQLNLLAPHQGFLDAVQYGLDSDAAFMAHETGLLLEPFDDF